MPDPDEDVVATNAAHWDAMADVHHEGRGRFYDLQALQLGEDPLWASERAALARVVPQGVAGLDVLHLQCHLGADAIAFARAGARVAGVAVSGIALGLAAARAAACGVEGIRWVQADASHPPGELDAAFDLVWATIGVTSWAPSVDAWMDAVARMLKPGGALALVEVHPFYSMVDSVAPLVIDFPYGGGAVHVFDTDHSYNDPEASVAAPRAACVPWSVGEHVGAALAAGLVVEHLEELLEADEDPRGLLAPEPDGLFRLRLTPGAPPVPLLFTLLARRPG